MANVVMTEGVGGLRVKPAMTDGWTDGRMDGWTGGRVDGWIAGRARNDARNDGTLPVYPG